MKPKIPKGWRYLQVEERIHKRDMLPNKNEPGWRFTGNHGLILTVYDNKEHGPYIRKVTRK